MGRVWAFGHEVGAKLAEINLSLFACLYSDLKPSLRNVVLVLAETVLRFEDVGL